MDPGRTFLKAVEPVGSGLWRLRQRA